MQVVDIADGKIWRLHVGGKTVPAITGALFVISGIWITNVFWSTTFQPSLKKVDNYEAVFSQGRAEFRRRDKILETHTEIVVSPEDDIELRRVHITNRSRKKRIIEITSYAEVVLAAPVLTKFIPHSVIFLCKRKLMNTAHAIICTRRPRSADEHNPWMFHLMKVHEAEIQKMFPMKPTGINLLAGEIPLIIPRHSNRH